MKNAVFYSRVSTESQDFQSQIDDLQRYAKAHDIEIIDTFSEKVSGYNLLAERTEYDNMKQFVLDNSIDLIICWELSRFGRNSLHTLNEIDFFTKKNVDIYFKKENISTLSNDPMAKLVLNLLSSIAEMERNTIVSRSKRGMVSSAQKGKRVGYVVMPYGFDADENGYIVINESEATNVRMMYEMASQGNSLRAIANRLNSLNIPTKTTKLGKKHTLRNGELVSIIWRTITVRKILKSTLYKGERNYNGGYVIPIPQIISEEVWNKVHTIFSAHIGYVNNTKYEYLFKGKMYCGSCGYIITSRTESMRKGLPSFYYCSGRKEIVPKCKTGQFNSKLFDELIYSQLFKNPSLMEKVYNETAKDFNLEEKQNQITYYRNEIVKLEGLKKRVNSLFKGEFITESELKQEHTGIRNSTVEMENNIKKIENEIQNFSGFDIKSIIKRFASETSFDIKHEFVTKFVDKITLYNVSTHDIDYSKQINTELYHAGYWNIEKGKVLKNPQGNDKLLFVEIYAFGNSHPLKISITNKTKQCFISDKLSYSNGHLSLQ